MDYAMNPILIIVEDYFSKDKKWDLLQAFKLEHLVTL